ncbi:MAG: hypothetical protein HYR86_09640, partial [Candidatus Rokubacteria bacterium]|nr:hypothetical protein [Candidatus Rokubacteria bacterium]
MPATRGIGSLAVVAATTAIVAVSYTAWRHIANPVIVPLKFHLIIVLVPAAARFWAAASVLAMLAFNFFFLPPVGTLPGRSA